MLPKFDCNLDSRRGAPFLTCWHDMVHHGSDFSHGPIAAERYRKQSNIFVILGPFASLPAFATAIQALGLAFVVLTLAIAVDKIWGYYALGQQIASLGAAPDSASLVYLQLGLRKTQHYSHIYIINI